VIAAGAYITTGERSEFFAARHGRFPALFNCGQHCLAEFGNLLCAHLPKYVEPVIQAGEFTG
jgi:hypothetical protein